MGYKTFISNTTATLSMAAVVSLGYSNLETSYSTNTPAYTLNNSFTKSTYNNFSKTENLEEIDVILAFANKLITNSKPLDADIAKLMDDNIMDLLS